MTLMLLIFFIIVLIVNTNEFNEEVIFPADQPLNFEKSEEYVDLFKVCEDGLGCIETDQTWYHKDYRPINLRPLERNIIKTEFLLIKNIIKDGGKLVYTNIQAKMDSIKKAGFSNETELMIVIHDFTANGYTGWIKHLAYTIFSNALSINLISVDWQRGAEPPYDQAIANARIVALEIIALIKELKEKIGFNLDNIHIVGHGVGAHIAGYVGNTYNKIKKITGLDPSGPRFENMPFNVKLNPRCAKYVEIIHTDYYHFTSQGINETLGHSDFYVNGAKKQPGCSENNNFKDLVSLQRGNLKTGDIYPGCSHKRAFKYFIESISNKKCSFQGIKCNNLEDFENGKCTSCDTSSHDCKLFGLKSYLETSENNKYFLNTATHFPFCSKHKIKIRGLEYRISIIVKNKEVKKYGYFDIIFIDENANVAEASLSTNNADNYRIIQGGVDHKNTFVYFSSMPKLYNIREAKVRWNEKKKIYCIFYCKQSIAVERIVVSFLGTGNNDASEEMYFCPGIHFVEIESGSYVTFERCNDKNEIETVHNKITTENLNPITDITSSSTATAHNIVNKHSTLNKKHGQLSTKKQLKIDSGQGLVKVKDGPEFLNSLNNQELTTNAETTHNVKEYVTFDSDDAKINKAIKAIDFTQTTSNTKISTLALSAPKNPKIRNLIDKSQKSIDKDAKSKYSNVEKYTTRGLEDFRLPNNVQVSSFISPKFHIVLSNKTQDLIESKEDSGVVSQLKSHNINLEVTQPYQIQNERGVNGMDLTLTLNFINVIPTITKNVTTTTSSTSVTPNLVVFNIESTNFTSDPSGFTIDKMNFTVDSSNLTNTVGSRKRKKIRHLH